MAAINTLREKGGKIIVGLIGFSILAFVGADLLGPNSTLLGGGKNNVGEIAGSDISYKDFLAKQDEMAYNWQQNNRRTPSSNDMISIRNLTWDALVAEMAFNTEFYDIGLKVSDEEIVDMVQGDNISAEIRQAFTNPETGEFSKDQVITFLQDLGEQTPAQRANWYNFEKNLGPGRLRLKFDNLIIKTNYATEEEAKFEYQKESSTAEINYLYVPFLPIADSTVSVSDSELEAYLSSHEDEYQKKEAKGLKYVSINVEPSTMDSALVSEEIDRMKGELIKSDNDSTYAVVNSDGNDAFKAYTPGQLPEALKRDDIVVGEGTVVGPVTEQNSYVVYKVSSIAPGDVSSARASHILFKWKSESDADKAEAKKEANGILRKIRNGSDFAEMARLHGTDGTKSKGGDLGWFSDGAMVAPFQEAVYAATNKGLLRNVVETQFGYHIIEVTEVKTNVVYKVAKVALEIFVSDETRNKFYRDAESFALKSSNQEEFEANARETGLSVKSVNDIDKNARRISGISEARNIVYWAYNTASVGKVSQVFEIDNQYVIAVLTSEQEEGAADLASVKYEITKKVTDQKKTDLVINKLNAMSGSLDEMATELGNGAAVYNMPALRLNSNTLNTVGLAPKAVGVAFSMENGETTQPFAVDNGVLIIEMVNKLSAPGISDYESYRTQILQKRQGRVAYNVDNAVKDLAEIVDERYKFF
jgi:peptidyl-prolyl cis-trans isomerase D